MVQSQYLTSLKIVIEGLATPRSIAKFAKIILHAQDQNRRSTRQYQYY